MAVEVANLCVLCHEAGSQSFAKNLNAPFEILIKLFSSAKQQPNGK